MEYRVYINREKHEAAGTLPAWEGFFRGEDGDFVFENILCYVGNGDGSGLGMARSFQSVLPENQMEIRQMDMPLMLSRADHGKFDVLVLSKEMADAFGAPLTLLERENTEELMIKG